MVAQNLLEKRPVGRLQSCEDDVLLGGQTGGQPEAADQLAERRTQLDAVLVLDPAVLDVKPVVEAAVALPVPAQVVVDRLPGQRPRCSQAEREPLLDALAEPVDPP